MASTVAKKKTIARSGWELYSEKCKQEFENYKQRKLQPKDEQQENENGTLSEDDGTTLLDEERLNSEADADEWDRGTKGENRGYKFIVIASNRNVLRSKYQTSLYDNNNSKGSRNVFRPNRISASGPYVRPRVQSATEYTRVESKNPPTHLRTVSQTNDASMRIPAGNFGRYTKYHDSNFMSNAIRQSNDGNQQSPNFVFNSTKLSKRRKREVRAMLAPVVANSDDWSDYLKPKEKTEDNVCSNSETTDKTVCDYSSLEKTQLSSYVSSECLDTAAEEIKTSPEGTDYGDVDTDTDYGTPV